MQFALHLSSLARARHRRELAQRRRRADDELRRGSHAARLAWRFDELTGADHRCELAAELREVADDLTEQDRFALSARPLNRVAARPHRFLLRRLATRLQDDDRPIDAAAVLAVEDFLCDGGSPLYSPATADELEPTLRSLLARVEAHT